jgi:hypothetical protein
MPDIVARLLAYEDQDQISPTYPPDGLIQSAIDALRTPSETREAQWVEGIPDDGECRWYRVGAVAASRMVDGVWIKHPVTRITVQRDLPGLHCDLWRVCVWSGESMIAEMPLHNVAAVGYAP